MFIKKRFIFYAVFIFAVLVLVWLINTRNLDSVVYSTERLFLALKSPLQCLTTGGLIVRNDKSWRYPLTKDDRIHPLAGNGVILTDSDTIFICNCPNGQFWGSMEEGCLTE